MSEFDKIRPVYEACVANADRLLSSAKQLSKPEQRHIAFHLAVMALEEIGKASMILTQLGPHGTNADDESETETELKGLDNHERKLFWALWTPSMATGSLSVEEFRELQGMAKRLHEERLDSLYVDASVPRFEITEAYLDRVLSMTTSRVEMEKAQPLKEPDQAKRDKLEWFTTAFEDSQLRGFILSSESMAKLAEAKGDSNQWISWLKEQIDSLNAKNQELLQKELNKSQGTPGPNDIPKWRIKVRFHTPTHIIRQKNLEQWNKVSKWIQLYKTKDSSELVVFLTLNSSVPIQAIWDVSYTLCNLFAIALSIAAVGIFWWYVPSFTARFYEEAFDIENEASFVFERIPPIRLQLDVRKLAPQELLRAGVILGHMVRGSLQHREAYKHYYQALALIGKNDIFSQFEVNIAVEFLAALREGLRAFGDWNGESETLNAAIEKVLADWSDSDARDHFRKLIDSVAGAAAQQQLSQPILLDDAMKMKALCDLYLTNRINEDIKKLAVANSPAGNSTQSNGADNPGSV